MMMRELTFSAAMDQAISDAMAEDPTIILIGEDAPMLRSELFTRFGPERIMAAPISEAAMLGTATGAAMSGLRPIVELYMVDFLAVAFDVVLNNLAKLEGFTGGEWNAPVTIRAPSGGWYGDGGQHSQSLWGMLAAIPGLTVAVASTPADAYGLMSAALVHDGPVIVMEPKLLSSEWLSFLGSGGRDTVAYDVPAAGAKGPVPESPHRIRFGEAATRRTGSDVTVVSVGVGVHRALAAAHELEVEGISCEVIDLRSLRPMDRDTVIASVRHTGKLVVVDEDYHSFGLSGELAAVCLEAGLRPSFTRVAVEDTIPYARHLEDAALPNPKRIAAAVRQIVEA
jgi:pyruvate dehydrogenase E1 component beta subunit